MTEPLRSFLLTSRAASVGAALAAFALVSWILPLPPAVRKGLLDLFPAPAQAATLLVCLAIYRAARPRNPRTGLGWLWIGLASAVAAPGGLFWAYYEFVLRREPVSPHFADYAYLATYPLEFVGVVLLFGTTRRADRVRALIDGLLVTLAAAAAVWLLVGEGLWSKSDLSLQAKLITTAQPLFDVVALMAGLMLTVSRTPNRFEQRGRYLLSAGLAIWGVGDILYARDTLSETFVTGIWYEITWTLSPLLIWMGAHQALAAVRSGAAPAEEDPALRSRSLQWLIPSALLFASAASIALDKAHILREAALPLMAISFPVGVLMIRQLVQLMVEERDGRRLLQRGMDLEMAVALQGRELEALHGLIGEINRSLDEEEVWEVALSRTREALGAVVTAVWVPTEDGGDALWRADGAPNGVDELPETALTPSETVQVQTLGGTPDSPTLLTAPIVWRDERFGTLGVVLDTSASTTARRLLTDIGRAIGPAVANARKSAADTAADRDPVTGLLNHVAIHAYLRKSLHAAADAGEPVSVLVLDIDNFQRFNHANGSLAGDAVLRTVARSLREACPAGSALGRYGGDEYCVVVPSLGPDAAERLERRIAEKVRAARAAPDLERLPLSVSLGGALFPRDGLHFHELLAAAERRLEDAKRRSAPRRGYGNLGRLSHTLAPLEAMVTAIDNKDQYTLAHSEDVAAFASWIADALQIGADATQALQIAALLHDIGKIGVPDAILRKPGKLTIEEFEAMKQHAALGAMIVGALPDMADVTPAIRHHHERWDGSGYPDRLAGRAIPRSARILAVADAFSAMTTDRPYRRAMAWREALDRIEQGAGVQFDPEVVRAFVHVLPSQMEGVRTAA